jgi:uncharacterized protein (TIGR02996 family)
MANQKPKKTGAKSVSAEEASFLSFLEAHPDDSTAHAAYADWLDEHGRPVDAAFQRAAAGLSHVAYKLRRKSDGLFSEAREVDHSSNNGYRWTMQGKSWGRLEELKAHLSALRRGDPKYGGSGKAGTPWSDLEIVIVEVCTVALAHLPLTFGNPRQGTPSVTIGEPVLAGGG